MCLRGCNVCRQMEGGGLSRWVILRCAERCRSAKAATLQGRYCCSKWEYFRHNPGGLVIGQAFQSVCLRTIMPPLL